MQKPEEKRESGGCCSQLTVDGASGGAVLAPVVLEDTVDDGADNPIAPFIRADGPARATDISDNEDNDALNW